MTRKPLISIKMLTYNHAPYIKKAIDSILAQRIEYPYEIVIGEDCSTDGTKEIVNEYAQKYPKTIKVITSDMNVGTKMNSIRTQQACSGKYIAWCEGDDYWHRNDKLQKQIEFLEKNSDYGLVCSDYDVYDTNTNEHINNYVQYRGWKVPQKITVEDFVGPIYYLGVAILTLTVVARKSLIDEVIKEDPFLHQNSNFKMGDTQLWAEMSLKSKIHFIDESLATHLVLKESATRSTNKLKRMRFQISGHQMSSYLCRKYDIDVEKLNYHEKWINYYLIRLAFGEHDKQKAKEFRSRKKKLTFSERILYSVIKSNNVWKIFAFICNIYDKSKDSLIHRIRIMKEKIKKVISYRA